MLDGFLAGFDAVAWLIGACVGAFVGVALYLVCCAICLWACDYIAEGWAWGSRKLRRVQRV